MSSSSIASPSTQRGVVIPFPMHRLKGRARIIAKRPVRRVEDEFMAIQDLIVSNARAAFVSDGARADSFAALLAAR